MQINVQNNKNTKITLEMIYEQIPTQIECNLTDILENRLIEFTTLKNLNYSYLYFLYNGTSILPSQRKKQISEIIVKTDIHDKKMTLLSYQIEPGIIQEDEIIIVLSIESVKIKKSTGGRGEKIKDIIKNIIELDLKWCTFKYRNNEIDIEQKFDDIVNEEDKRQLKIDLTLNYTIPLIVNISKAKKSKYSKYSIQCLLGDRIGEKIYQYFKKKKYNSDDYDLICENKIFESYYNKKFYEIIPEDKIQNISYNSQINETIQTFPTSENLNELNQIKYNNEKIMALPINEASKGKIEIEIKVKLKSCNVRYRRKLRNCCDKFKHCCNDNCLKDVCSGVGLCIGYIIGGAFVFFLFGGWLIFI